MPDPDPREPDNVETANEGRAGEAQTPSPFRVMAEERPNYDEREERLSNERKPAGPRLREGADERFGVLEDDRDAPEPTDPEEDGETTE